MDRDPIRLPRRIGPGGRTVEFPPNGWGPAEALRRIGAEPREWLYVYDPAVVQLARFRGTADTVDLSDELKARTGGLYGESLLRDCLIVHNHPATLGAESVASFPPSPSDLLMAVERDLREFAVVSGNVRYVVRRPGANWPTDEGELAEMIRRLIADEASMPGAVTDGQRGAVARWLRVLARLASEGWIDYAAAHRPPGVR